MANRRVNETTLFKPLVPDFLCIGAQRSGTTWLYEHLKAHSDFEMPPYKELHYFNNMGEAGLSIRELAVYKKRLLLISRFLDNFKHPSMYKLKWDIHYLFSKRTDPWYLSLFVRAPGKLTGDISPAYSILDDQIVQHISIMLPATKVIFILRNPITRAWSHAKMDYVRFHKKRIVDVTHKEIIDHFESKASILRTDYIRTLDIWERYFPPERFFIGFYDDIVTKPNTFLENVLSFLGAGPARRQDSSYLNRKINASGDEELPSFIHRYLAKKYGPVLEDLYRRFGTKVQPWLAEKGKVEWNCVISD